MGSVIRLSAVNASFAGERGRVSVLDDVSLEVRRGEFVSIVGPSGCGKSTLLSILTGAIDPDSGTVLIDGVPPARRGVRGTDGARPAWMPQQDLLFPWRTVAGNVALGAEVARGLGRKEALGEANQLLERFGIGGFGNARPHELSGGMRQRAALARTVAQGRETLLLDEPFGGLDAITRMEVCLWLEQVREHHGWTVVLVTHDIREAALLSDSVHVFSRRPASVVTTVEVGLEHPRSAATLTDPRFEAVERDLIAALGIGDKRSGSGGS